jgi:hypothetical protein
MHLCVSLRLLISYTLLICIASLTTVILIHRTPVNRCAIRSPTTVKYVSHHKPCVLLCLSLRLRLCSSSHPCMTVYPRPPSAICPHPVGRPHVVVTLLSFECDGSVVISLSCSFRSCPLHWSSSTPSSARRETYRYITYRMSRSLPIVFPRILPRSCQWLLVYHTYTPPSQLYQNASPIKQMYR